MIYQLLDYFFLVFHGLLIIINVLGWIWSRTRKLQLYVLALTLFSWLIMGYFYGWGYCVLTDWHWDVLQELGQRPDQNAYVQYLFYRWFNLDVTREFSDQITIVFLLVGVAGAIYMRWVYAKIKKR